MAKKPYMQSGPEGLLARVLQAMDLGYEVYGPVEGHRPSVKACRSVMGELLAMSEDRIVVGQGARAELREWSDDDVMIWRELILGAVLWSMLPKSDRAVAPGQGWPADLRIAAIRQSGNVVMRLDGSAGAALMFQVVNLLRIVGLDRMLHCDCGRRFIRVGRQEFCSERCQNRSYMRRRREAERPTGRRRGKATRT